MNKTEFKIITKFLWFCQLSFFVTAIYIFVFYFKNSNNYALLTAFLTLYYSIFFYGLNMKYKKGFYEDLKEKIDKSNDLFYKSKRRTRRKMIRKIK